MQRSNLTKTIGAKAGKRKKMALGKGLGALIPEVDTATSEQKDFFFCDIDLIRPNRFQPRIRFSEEDLQELTDSIKAQGILQPVPPVLPVVAVPHFPVTHVHPVLLQQRDERPILVD
jgi:ParB family chromosome partitioning protein